MTFRQIHFFLVLSDELHFWKSAEKLFISQSSLSRQILQMEEELGFELFERDKRNVKLTQAGLFLKKNWSSLWDDYQRGLTQARKINEGSSGRISITYPGSIAFRFLPELMKQVHNLLPELTIELIEPPDENHIKLLLDFQVDLAFSRDRFAHPEIVSEKLYDEPVCLVVPENHMITENNFHSLKALESDNFIISRLHDSTFFASFLRDIFARYGIQPHTIIESDFGAMILSLVSKGLGVTILPESYKYAAIPGVRFINMDEQVSLYVNRRKNDPNKIMHKVLELSIIIKSALE